MDAIEVLLGRTAGGQLCADTPDTIPHSETYVPAIIILFVILFLFGYFQIPLRDIFELRGIGNESVGRVFSQ